jgi:predicted RNA-binding protein with PIN domain
VAFDKHLLIDGYNVIHAWPGLKKVLLREGAAAARERLCEAARVLHDFEKIRVSFVFDGRGERIEIERPGRQLTFSVVFSPAAMTADGVIEQLVGKAEDPGLILVATSDGLERQTVEALGAKWLSPRDLEVWIKRARDHQDRELTRRKGANDNKWRK